MAQQVAEERRRLKIVKERISICRRDISKLISAAIEEGASGNWGLVESQFLAASPGFRGQKPPMSLPDAWMNLPSSTRKSSTCWKIVKFSKNRRQ